MGAKTSLLILLVLCIMLGLMRSPKAVSLGSGHEVVNIGFWNGFTGPDGRIMLTLVRKFNDTDGGAQVTMQRIAWATYYNKVMVSAMDGRGPDVFVLQADYVPRMHRAGFLDVVNDVFGPNLELKSDYSDRLLELVRLDDGGQEKYLGVPLDTWPHGMYCNKEMLKSAGFVDEAGDPRPPRNREEFLKAAAVMQRDIDDPPDGRPDYWGYAFGHWRYNFMSLAPQFGGRYMDENGEPTIDCPGNIQALQFLRDLLQNNLAPPPEGGVAGWVGFRQQRVGMVFDGIYMLGDLQRLKDHPYYGAPIPQIGPQPGAFADSHILCIRKGLDPRRRAAAARFVKFLMEPDNSLAWAGAGQVAARRSVRESEAFKQLQVQYAFSKQIDYVLYPPKTPSILEFFLHLDAAVERAVRGRQTPAEALAQAQRDFKRYLEVDRIERQRLESNGTGGNRP
jgi:multiple sugar transport system substrate-binding protein